MTLDKKEKRFEQDIETFFLSEQGGYVSLKSSQFDLDKCICMDTLCKFIEKTQPKAWAKYVKYYGVSAKDKLYNRLEKCISEQGLLYVLRHGITDLGIKLKICYFKPETSLNDVDVEHYKENILGCTRQFRYSPHNTNTIDMVLSVNGIPVVSLELKNQLTGQDYQCAIEQYKTDRSSKEFCFRLDHRFLVYFAVDLYEVWMTTQLKDSSTYFMPFNQGSNGAGVYRLASVHDSNDNGIFDSVIVVTNRVVLDGQLQDTINSFEHKPGLVEAIDEKKNSHSLAEAINDGKRIIICTIQKFLFAYKDMEQYSGKKFAIIIDEAHQGQSGESARTLRRSLIDIGIAVKEYAEEQEIDVDDVDLTDEYINAVIGQGKHANQSFFAFTATPKCETLEVFGTPTGEYTQDKDGNLKQVKAPFHVYSMRQAIEEGFILDVLSNYTTVKEAFKLIKTSADNPELIEGPASKALFKYYKKHGYTITQKTEMIMSNFLSNGRYQINGKGKAMVVADSRANAVRYYLAIKQYMKDHPQESAGCDVMIAFSGEITLDEIITEKPFTEATMNVDENGKYITSDKKFREVFHSGLYNILVVANKYQTGFDEPLLHSMYVDKKLQNVTAVQTLSRLNRTTFGKQSTFVLDFENTDEDIKQAFLPFYKTTVLEGTTDLNRVYDLRNKISEFMLFNYADVEAFTRRSSTWKTGVYVSSRHRPI